MMTMFTSFNLFYLIFSGITTGVDFIWIYMHVTSSQAGSSGYSFQIFLYNLKK